MQYPINSQDSHIWPGLYIHASSFQQTTPTVYMGAKLPRFPTAPHPTYTPQPYGNLQHTGYMNVNNIGPTGLYHQTQPSGEAPQHQVQTIQPTYPSNIYSGPVRNPPTQPQRPPNSVRHNIPKNMTHKMSTKQNQPKNNQGTRNTI